MRQSTLALKMAHNLQVLSVALAEVTNDDKAWQEAVVASNKAWCAYLEHLNPWLDC